ncbi:hypothetical protein O3M35_004801 [Rhynocoris fuscipes]|uniref:Mitochondrial assembly of ribosomal large subunit protein 1 n=1 Tax=Rhynocoris fuscipes TaxID=488301 RepID=A0AAW1DHL4_9HEMI
MSLLVSRTFFRQLYHLNSSSIFNKSLRLLCSHKDNDSFTPKYKVFKDEDSEVIYDVQEERLKQRSRVAEKKYPVQDFNVERSETGVLSVENVVELLKSHHANDIFVIKLPIEMNYANFMVIITGNSRRHLNGLAELIKREFKCRRINQDSVPTVEGTNSDWIAIDLGNIVVHLMMESIRETYDLESLWAVGAKYDLKSNTVSSNEEVLQLLKKHSINLDDLQPKT